MPVKKSKVKSQNVKPQLKIKNFEFCVVVFTFTFSLLPLFCYAAPCYGTKMPEKNKFFAGVGNHTIFKRYLEDEFGKVRSTQNFLLISYGVFDWFTIDLKGGAGNIKQHPIGSDEVDYASNFAGGYGLRLRLYDDEKSNPVRNTEYTRNKNKISNGAKVVFGFQHISVHPKSTHLGIDRNKAILDDWQVSLLASRDCKKITPYLGVRWSRIDYIHRVVDTRKRRMSDLTKSAGLIYGLDLAITERAWINLEGSAFDSEALAFSINFKF